METISEVTIDFTVAIPTYNGEKRLPQLLEKLRHQANTDAIVWEVIVVDNNSSDRTAQIVRDYQENWPQSSSLRYYLEQQQGAAFARQRGLEEARGDWVGFIDDDNLPDCEWVSQAYHFAQRYPQAGAFGGRIEVEFEVPPPPNFDKIKGFFSARERGDVPHRYQPEVLSLPTAAAMVVRKQVWRDCFGSPSLFRGRVGTSMIGGEDWEPLMCMHKVGWEIWYNPKMRTYHQVPHWRIEREYLLSLIRGACLSFCPLRMMVAKTWQKPLILGRTVLGNSYKLLSHVIKYRGRFQSDLVAECELKIYLSRIESAFYYLRTVFSSS